MELSIEKMKDAISASGGTSLITVYIPSGYDLSLTLDRLTSEMSTAHNIKSKIVRKDVITALKTGLYQLKNYKRSKAPENGLVLCTGRTLNRCYV